MIYKIFVPASKEYVEMSEDQVDATILQLKEQGIISWKVTINNNI